MQPQVADCEAPGKLPASTDRLRGLRGPSSAPARLPAACNPSNWTVATTSGRPLRQLCALALGRWPAG
eukprot:1082541-Alexandrium_andersonii.AAC.1